MDKEEAVRKLEDLQLLHDNEILHGEADEILVEFLRDNGFSDVADAYENLSDRFWYA